MLEICQNDFVSTYCGIVKHLCKGGMKLMLDGIPWFNNLVTDIEIEQIKYTVVQINIKHGTEHNGR